MKPDIRCDLCGKFRKIDDLVRVGGEYDESWVECRFCCSKGLLESYFNKQPSGLGDKNESL